MRQEEERTDNRKGRKQLKGGKGREKGRRKNKEKKKSFC